MMVTLIETYRIFNMTLPDKVKGRFWITDVDSFGNDRKLISVEADEGSWVLKGSDSAVICDTHNRIADDTVLEDNVFYNVRILEENEEGYVYAQPDDIGRQTFDKYVFRDNAELTIGRDSDNTVCIKTYLSIWMAYGQLKIRTVRMVRLLIIEEHLCRNSDLGMFFLLLDLN